MSVDNNYYMEFDVEGVGGRGNHIARQIEIIHDINTGEKEKAGLVLCNNRVSFHSGSETSGLDWEFLEDVSICPPCLKEYKERNE